MLAALSDTDYWTIELVLMYCSFLALKAHNDLTVEMGPGEYTPVDERKLFQA